MSELTEETTDRHGWLSWTRPGTAALRPAFKEGNHEDEGAKRRNDACDWFGIDGAGKDGFCTR